MVRGHYVTGHVKIKRLFSAPHPLLFFLTTLGVPQLRKTSEERWDGGGNGGFLLCHRSEGGEKKCGVGERGCEN